MKYLVFDSNHANMDVWMRYVMKVDGRKYHGYMFLKTDN